ncbi:MAG: MATE family efflux transporter [Lachnospiraceae bacterium]
MQKENKMGTMPIPKLVITMSFPIMVSMLVQSLYNIVDSIFVAQIDEAALTATSIAYSAQMLQIAVAVGTGVGVNALVSRQLGAKNYDKANTAATLGLLLSIASSLIFVIWGIFGTDAFIHRFSTDENIIAYGVSYLRICQLFSTGLFLGTFTQRLLQATGRTVSSMFAQMAGAVVNIVLDPILIFGYLGAPGLGITGAAIATVIGQWVSALIGLILNYVQNKEIHFVWKQFHFQKNDIIAIYRVGAPTILTQAFSSLMVAGMNLILGIYSDTAVAFFGVYFKLQSFLFMPMNGLGQGALPIVGFNTGANNRKRVMDACKIALSLAAVIACIGIVVFEGIPETLLSFFNAKDAMLEIGIPALRIIAPTFLLAAITMVTGYIISGLGNGMVNMIGTAIRQLIVLLPLVWLFGRFWGMNHVWYAFWISETAAVLYAVLKLKHHLKCFR